MKTLKEQYKEIVGGYNEQYTENVSNKCVEIAENYCITFVSWLEKRTMKEFLELFKMQDGIKELKSWQDFEAKNKSVKLKEDFAIGFAKWLIDSEDKPKGAFTIKELLEIYKKQK